MTNVNKGAIYHQIYRTDRKNNRAVVINIDYPAALSVIASYSRACCCISSMHQLMKLTFYGGVSRLSRSIIILKEIDGFSYENTLSSVQRASNIANIHCIHLEMAQYFNIAGTKVEYLSGALSEVGAEILKSNFEKGIHTRQCVFSIKKPTDSSYDSFTWLVNKKNYFGALDFEYLSGDYEFVFQFLSHYFRLKENLHDYLWFDDAEWVYSASDMMWLSNQPYNPEWAYKKITPAQG